MNAQLRPVSRELLCFDGSSTRACVRRAVAMQPPGPWYAVATRAAPEIRREVLSLGGTWLASVAFELGEAHRRALQRLVVAHGMAAPAEFPPTFEPEAIEVSRRLRALLRAQFTDARARVCWAPDPLALCVVADETGVRADHFGGGAAGLALRTGLRTTFESEFGPRPERGLAIALGQCPTVAGAHWSVSLEPSPPGIEADAIEAVVLRCALEAISSSPPGADAAIDGPPDSGPFRPAALAEWKKGRTATGLPLLWPVPLQRIATALVALILCAPLLLLIPVQDSVRCAATIVAPQRRDVVAPFAGTVTRLGPAAGASLQRGAALFHLIGHAGEGDAEGTLRDYSSQVAQRLLDPAASDGVAARASLQQARSRLESLAGTTLRASLDGVLADVAAGDGLAVAAGQRLATLLPARAEAMLDIRIPAEHAPRIVVGTIVSVALDDPALPRLPARIVAVGGIADEANDSGRYVVARARFETAHETMPPPGARATVDVGLGRSSVFALLTHTSESSR